MTDTVISKDTADGLWTRLRQALTGSRPGPERAPAYGQAAIARSIGMKPKLGARIEEELLAGWNRAAHSRVSLSLLVIEIDRIADYFNAYGKAAADECVLAVMQAIAGNLPRPDDTCLRLGRATFVVVLPDLPVLLARSTASRMAEAIRTMALPHKESHAGIVTVGMGLAVTNPEGHYDRRFFEAAAEGVRKAQRRGLGRIETIDLRPAQERRRQAA